MLVKNVAFRYNFKSIRFGKKANNQSFYPDIPNDNIAPNEVIWFLCLRMFVFQLSNVDFETPLFTIEKKYVRWSYHVYELLDLCCRAVTSLSLVAR